jgi:autotransporter-associated beta strand protein
VPRIVISDQSIVVSTTLAGTNGMTKSGAGTLVLTNYMTYTGETIVNAGNLTLAVGGVSGTLSSRTMTVNPGASVTATVANALGYNGTAWVTNLNLYGSTFTTAITSTNVGDQGWGLTVNLMGGTLTSLGTNSEFAVGGGWMINTIATNVPSVISGTLRTRNSQPNYLIPFNVAAGSASPDLLVSAVINNFQTGDGIVKTGAGVMVLTATNTYDGVTVVSNGTLEVDGALANGGLAVYGGTLKGVGSIASAVTVSGGALGAGTASGIGTLTINNTLDLTGGAATIRLNKTGSVLTNDNVQGLFGVTYGGTLTVTATGNALTAGDKFTLFYSPAYSGSFGTFNLPALSGALAWDTSKLTVDGSIKVITSSVNTTPPTITNVVSSGSLKLSWPVDHIGWRLLVQTNHLTAGVSANAADWMTVPGSSTTNQVSVPIDAAKFNEFYKMVYP